MFIKFANADLLEAKVAHKGDALLKNAHRASFNYTPREGYLYVRSRAISSRTNDNFDSWPADELRQAWATFIGKPVFVNHHNQDHRRMRGVIIDAALHEDTSPDGTEDTWIEVLMEVDAVRFPRLAQAILNGDIERTSMGADVGESECSFCGKVARTPSDYCTHVQRHKGQRLTRRNPDGSQEEVLVHEICRKISFFENSLLVEPPADPTAFFLGVDDSGVRSLGMTAKTAAAKPKGALRFTSRQGVEVWDNGHPDSVFDPDGGRWTVYCTAHGHLMNTTSLDMAKYLSQHPDEFCEVHMYPDEWVEDDGSWYPKESSLRTASHKAVRGFPATFPDGLGRKALEIYRRLERGAATVDDIMLFAAQHGRVGSQWAMEDIDPTYDDWENTEALAYAECSDDTRAKEWVEWNMDFLDHPPSDDEIWEELGDNLGEISIILIGTTDAKYINGEWDAEIGQGSKIRLTEIRYNAGWGWQTLRTDRTVTAALTGHEVYGPFPPRERSGPAFHSHCWAVRYRSGSLITEYLFMEEADAVRFAEQLRSGTPISEVDKSMNVAASLTSRTNGGAMASKTAAHEYGPTAPGRDAGTRWEDVLTDGSGYSVIVRWPGDEVAMLSAVVNTPERALEWAEMCVATGAQDIFIQDNVTKQIQAIDKWRTALGSKTAGFYEEMTPTEQRFFDMGREAAENQESNLIYQSDPEVTALPYEEQQDAMSAFQAGYESYQEYLDDIRGEDAAESEAYWNMRGGSKTAAESFEVRVQFLDKLPDGSYDLDGRAVATCPYCGEEITASGYMNACSNALRKHVGLEHNISAPMLPPPTAKLAWGEQKAPPKVNTLGLTECPVCGTSNQFDSTGRCTVCSHMPAPEPFRQPDLDVAQKVDMRDGWVNPDLLAAPAFVPPEEVSESDPVQDGTTPDQGVERVGGTTMRPSEVVIARLSGENRRLAAENSVLRRRAGLAPRRADVDNPAQPVPEGPAEGASQSTDETRAPDATTEVDSIGAALTDVAPDATTQVDAIGGTLTDVGPDATANVTSPVSGGSEPVPYADAVTLVQPDASGGTEMAPAFSQDNSWVQGSKTAEARVIARIRLARLRLQAGIEQGDDLVIAQKIASSGMSDAQVRTEIETLSKVTRNAAQQRPVGRRVQREAARGVPSLAGGAPSFGSNEVGSDEVLW